MADTSLAKKLMGWEPEVSFSDGLDRTIRWYFETQDRDDIAVDFEASLTERGLEKAGRKQVPAARAGGGRVATDPS